MRNVFGIQQREHVGERYAVVRAQRGAVGVQAVAVEHEFQRILGKVEVKAVVLHAHHVHVSLKNHGGSLFHTGRAGFADENVACFVLPDGETAFVGEGYEIVAELTLVL